MAAASCAALAVLAGAPKALAADDAALLRVFLADGTSLVSYGEPARVADRVVFSMPASTAPNPPLNLISLPIDRVDWDRTTRYATNARATRYLATQAEADYAALSNQVAMTLNEIARAPDATARLAVVARARQALADWPQTHYNYRLAEVRQMISMLDEALADLRAMAGARRFDLSLSASVEPVTPVEPLLPPPTPQESIAAVLTAARTVDGAADRMALLDAAVTAIDRDRESLPADWAAKTRLDAEAARLAERRVDRSYRTLTSRMLALATVRARAADVRGLERLVRSIRQRDAALGGKRPESVTALVAAVEEELDAARRLHLARERWALRSPAFHAYRTAMAAPLDLFASLKPSLENIKSLAGSTPSALTSIQRAAARILKLASAIAPPEELVAAHALLVSAVQLAANAAQIRREAALAGDMARAWDASSAAAGALMLGARARSDMQALFRPPELR